MSEQDFAWLVEEATVAKTGDYVDNGVLWARERIAALEKVAEAAEQSIVNKHGIWVGPTVIQTLRAAGYLGEGNE